MKYVIAICFLFLCLNAIHAQQKIDTIKSKLNLDAAAQKMVQLLTDKNYSEFANYVHPKIISMAGGKDKLIALTKQGIESMESQGFTLKKVFIDSATGIIVAGKELQSVIAQHLKLATKDGSFVATSYLLAISDNGGIKWYFVDASNKTLLQMKTIFPSLSNKLIIPAQTQPVFTHN